MRRPCRYALGQRPVTRGDQALGGLPVLSIRTPYRARSTRAYQGTLPLNPRLPANPLRHKVDSTMTEGDVAITPAGGLGEGRLHPIEDATHNFGDAWIY